jgi:hypothetical protein
VKFRNVVNLKKWTGNVLTVIRVLVIGKFPFKTELIFVFLLTASLIQKFSECKRDTEKLV